MDQAPLRSPLPFGISSERATVWLLLGFALYLLRGAFTIVFLTFIMSYLAEHAVSVLAGPSATASGRRWARQSLVVTIYLGGMAASYLAFRSIVPAAVEQGKTLLVDLGQINVDQLRDQVLGATIGRIELAKFRHGDKYDTAFKDFFAQRYSSLTYQEARQVARDITRAFEDFVAAQEGLRRLTEAKRGEDFDDRYRQWLLSHRAQGELAQNPDLARRLADEFDASFRVVEGEVAFRMERDSAAYRERRQAACLQRVAAQMMATGEFKDEAQAEIAKALGQESLAALPAAERERRMKEFYAAEVPHRFPSVRYTYEQFLLLQSIQSEDEFRRKLGQAAPDPAVVSEKFDAWMALKLAKESPLSDLVWDTSRMMSTTIPVVTGWLTTAINSMLAFGLDALVALMLSLMIVWDLPRLERATRALEGTWGERLYREVAPDVALLASVIGLAFSAQLIVAGIDGALGFVALKLLGLPSPVFLSLILVLCALVPYFGVLLGGVPILIVALQHGGVGLGLEAAAAIVALHELEAWVLGPLILGEILHLSPAAIIAILFLAEPLFGVWGLVLGVPVVGFILRDVVFRPITQTPPDARASAAPAPAALAAPAAPAASSAPPPASPAPRETPR